MQVFGLENPDRNAANETAAFVCLVEPVSQPGKTWMAGLSPRRRGPAPQTGPAMTGVSFQVSGSKALN
jgi:hypothetical protein